MWKKILVLLAVAFSFAFTTIQSLACLGPQPLRPEILDSAAVIFRGRITSTTSIAGSSDKLLTFKTIKTYRGMPSPTQTVRVRSHVVDDLASFKKWYGEDTILALSHRPLFGVKRVLSQKCGPTLMAKFGIHRGYSSLMEQLWLKGIVPSDIKIDTDGDGVISFDEIKAFRKKLRDARQAARPMEMAEALDQQLKTKARRCRFPSVPAGAEVFLIGTPAGTAISTAALGNSSYTTLADIEIERGKKPLYIVARSRKPTIWRFSGSTARVKVLVGAGVGAIGLVRKAVHSVPSDCIVQDPIRKSQNSLKWSDSVKNPSGQQLLERAHELESRFLAYALGTAPALIVTSDRPGGSGIYEWRISKFSLPSGRRVFQSRLTGARSFGKSGDGAVLWKWFYKSNPGGVVDIDPATVMSKMTVTAYPVLPSEAGFAQLIEAGTLEAVGWKHGLYAAGNLSVSDKHAILAAFAGYIRIPFEFRVKKKMRVPYNPSIFGQRGVTLFLADGVAMPVGELGSVCVRRETSGEALTNTCG